jgi:thioredoxin 1
MKTLLSALLWLLLSGCGESTTGPRKAVVTEYHPSRQGPDFVRFLRHAVPAGRVPVVYFYADWCGPCRRFRAALPSDEVEQTLQQATLVKVNVDSCRELAAAYGVQAVPTFVKVDAQGQPLATITSDKWGEDVPGQIAPVLEQLVNGHSYDTQKRGQ